MAHLEFDPAKVAFFPRTGRVIFPARSGDRHVYCAVSEDALALLAAGDKPLGEERSLAVFNEHRSMLQQIALEIWAASGETSENIIIRDADLS